MIQGIIFSRTIANKVGWLCLILVKKENKNL